MRVTIIAVGQMREKPYRAMAEEYLTRLSRFGSYQVVELPDLPEPKNASPAEEETVRRREGEAILRVLKPGQRVIALAIEGRQYASEELAAHLRELAVRGVSDIALVIGGSLGLSPAVMQRADETLSMGKMTFPHQLARVMLLEQLYRCEKISAGERYHK